MERALLRLQEGPRRLQDGGQWGPERAPRGLEKAFMDNLKVQKRHKLVGFVSATMALLGALLGLSWALLGPALLGPPS